MVGQVLRPLPMIVGSLYQIRRSCGNTRCKCARGQLHVSWYLSRRTGGRTKLIYIGRVVPEWLATRAHRYQRFQKTLAAIRKIDAAISAALNQLRDAKLKTFDKARQ